jgi:acyl-CoA ligase (AMP-forming) (exosortase A-associated)
MLKESASRVADQEALIFGEQRHDYETMAQRASALANGLRELGIRRGDRVAIYLPPSATLALAIFAVSEAGAVFVPIHHGLFASQVSHILRDSGSKALLTDGRRWNSLEDIVAEAQNLAFAVVESGGSETPGNPCPMHDLEALSRESSTVAAGERCIGKDLAAILYTSGSTGQPKGVMLSHANVIAGAEIVSDYLGITRRDRLLAALPFSFDAGLNQLMTAVLQGGTTVMVNFQFGRDIVKMLVEERITGLAGVPSLWSLLAQPSSGLGNQPESDLRYITNTGGVLPQNVLVRLRALLPETEVFLMYGLTEAFRSTYLPPEELNERSDSIGKAIPNTEILVINEAGRECAPGEVGELIHHGPTVSLGYWGDPELTSRRLRPHPIPLEGREEGDRVCYSGDMVRRDEDGFLYFVGRRDNQIKSAGFRISPTEVETALCQVEHVRHSAVIGVPDPILGQHLVAFAVAEEKAELDPAVILAQCAASLPRHMIPKRVELISELPMMLNGKVDYSALRKHQAANRSITN